VLPLILPPAIWVTVMVALEELAEAQTPLCTTARNNVVCVRFVYDCVVVEFAIVVQVVPPLIDCSHLITLPVLPLNVTDPLLPVEHTVAVPPAVPPTETGSTVIVVNVDVSVHVPFVKTAQYTVVAASALYAWLVVVLTIFVQLDPPLVERIHFDIVPV
jgi:hypothetical protein